MKTTPKVSHTHTGAMYIQLGRRASRGRNLASSTCQVMCSDTGLEVKGSFLFYFIFSKLLSSYHAIYLEGYVYSKWMPFSKSHKDTTGASRIPSPPPIQGRVG